MYKVIDLFCGAGGFALGFQKAGFQILCAIDQNEQVLNTYSRNISCEFVINADISTLHSLDIINLVGISNLPDVIIASPPCEPYTAANYKRRKKPLQRLYDDPIGRLVLDAIRLIGDLNPKAFVIENVKGLIEGDLKDALIREFEYVGIKKIYFNILNAEHYGCPSKRSRVFISNVELKLKREKITPDQYVINVLPENSIYEPLPNHNEITIMKSYMNKLAKLKQGGALVYFRSARGKKHPIRNWVRLKPYELAPTVMGNSRFIHPFEDRALTVREHARLMTFPDDYTFIGGIESQFDQVGEAVPPLLSYKIAIKIKEYLAMEEKISLQI
ncbi:MAG: DNA cytosine methyltransferase [Candidatus Helarchaeota archaeon]